MLKSAVLWIHVLSGTLWVGTCMTFLLAASATSSDGEKIELAARTLPRLNRLNLIAAALVLLTGLLNLFFVGRTLDFHFPRAFTTVLGAKLLLFFLMCLALSASSPIASALGRGESGGLSRLMRLYGAIALCGSIALGLGLWLAGSA